MPVVLSKIQAQPILDARRSGKNSVTSSTDLNRSMIEMALGDRGLALPDGVILTWEQVEHVARKDNNCFVVVDGQIEPVHRFSTDLNRGYTLRATSAAPTLLISGFPMHRIKGITPDQDTTAKIKAIGPLSGQVLDTTTGLGYATIQAAHQGARVTCIELDPLVLEVARLNPWSAGLFENPLIKQIVGDSFEVIQQLESGGFNVILHDPPTFSLAGDLYSEAFYKQAHRVLRPSGRFFHYVGDLESRAGRVVSKGVVKRMQASGFKRIVRHPEAFALVAYKS